MAGYRFPNYFLERVKQSVFNRMKYKSYYSYLEAKGFIHAKTAKYRKPGITRKRAHAKLPFHSRIY